MAVGGGELLRGGGLVAGDEHHANEVDAAGRDERRHGGHLDPRPALTLMSPDSTKWPKAFRLTDPSMAASVTTEPDRGLSRSPAAAWSGGLDSGSAEDVVEEVGAVGADEVVGAA